MCHAKGKVACYISKLWKRRVFGEEEHSSSTWNTTTP
jgi:hypothetical protein